MKNKKLLYIILPICLIFLILFTLKIIGPNKEESLKEEVLNNTYDNEEESKDKNIIVYFPNWRIYNESHQNFTVGDIPWEKVTIINHAFFTVSSSFKLESTDSFADFDKSFPNSQGWEEDALRGHLGEYKYYKSLYPDKKVLISIGGWTRGENFHNMAKTKESRKIFIDSVIDFLNTYPFIDGIDIDWEYPGGNREKDPNDEYDRGCPGGPEDKENFTLLLKEIREAYNENKMENKMLTIANTANYDKLILQEPDKYIQYLDYINVMTYDYHGAFENTTNHHAPIYMNKDDPTSYGKYSFCAEDALNMYVKEYNIPKYKLNVGSPFYSRGWSGVNDGTGNNGLFSSATKGYSGSWDNPQTPGGQIPWFQLKDMENKNGWVKYFDKKAQVPYLYNKSLQSMLTYEDEDSLKERCNFVNKNGYGGMIIWEITGDDKSKNFPLTTLIWESFGSPKSSSTATENTNSNDPDNNTPKPPTEENLNNSINVTFEVTSDWTSGANWSMTIKNVGSTSISSWSISFESDKKINQCWDGNLTSNGNEYTITNPTWGGTIKPNESVTIGGSCEGNSKDYTVKNIKVTSK